MHVIFHEGEIFCVFSVLLFGYCYFCVLTWFEVWALKRSAWCTKLWEGRDTQGSIICSFNLYRSKYVVVNEKMFLLCFCRIKWGYVIKLWSFTYLKMWGHIGSFVLRWGIVGIVHGQTAVAEYDAMDESVVCDNGEWLSSWIYGSHWREK